MSRLRDGSDCKTEYPGNIQPAANLYQLASFPVLVSGNLVTLSLITTTGQSLSSLLHKMLHTGYIGKKYGRLCNIAFFDEVFGWKNLSPSDNPAQRASLAM
jgi:hypothetical protein